MHSAAAVVPFRPAALPAIGYRVDVHEFGYITMVVLFQHRLIASQRTFDQPADATAYARQLAGEHGCPVIHHNHRGAVDA